MILTQGTVISCISLKLHFTIADVCDLFSFSRHIMVRGSTGLELCDFMLRSFSRMLKDVIFPSLRSTFFINVRDVFTSNRDCAVELNFKIDRCNSVRNYKQVRLVSWWNVVLKVCSCTCWTCSCLCWNRMKSTHSKPILCKHTPAFVKMREKYRYWM